jgi:protein-disulfide isomerase
LAGDPYKGNPDAELVVVEFADYQCAPCQRHALETQPVLDETFVEPGEIMWVYKNLPLREHPLAPVAAVAGECAGEQGQFWEMHHLLYETMEGWSAETDADGAFLALAEQLELDRAAFDSCLGSRAALERVLSDLYDAQGIVSQTPNFVVLKDGRGYLMQSSLPAEQFVKSLQGRLEPAQSQE